MIPPQSFGFSDIPVIWVLIILEGLLSADNALVLALLVRHLPDKERQRALLYGLGGAFVFRGIALLAASWVIALWWLQLIGAAYLIYLTAKHFLTREQDHEVKSKAGLGFWQTVIMVEITDMAFAIDSVIAAIGVIRGPDKLWVAYAGAIIGVALLRWAAGFFTTLIDKYPALEHLAYSLVGWVGVKLLLMSGHNFIIDHDKRLPNEPLPFHIPEMDEKIFWIGMALICIVGGAYAYAKRNRKQSQQSD